MSTIGKPIKLINPGSSKRLTWKQKLHFGTKRQRAAAAIKLKGRSNPRHSKASRMNRKVRRAKSTAQAKYYKQKHNSRVNKRYVTPNVGEIITIRPATSFHKTSNPGGSKRKKGNKSKNYMAKSQKRRLAGLKAARTRKRRLHARHSSSSNPGHRRRTYRRRSTAVATTPRRRRNPRRRSSSNPGVRRHSRRSYSRRRGHTHNPGFMSGAFGQALGIIAGAFVTKFIMGFVPSQLSQGIPGYITTALVAMFQGKAVGKLLKNPKLGNDMQIGGYVYLALKIANDYMPGLGLPFGLNGLGMPGPSTFYTPQVPINGSMGRFQLPSSVTGAMALAAPAAAGMRGLTQRRVGRMR